MVLRAFVFAVGAILTACGILLCLVQRNPSGVPPLTAGVLIIVGVGFERWRYSRLDSRPPAGPQWQKTAERFVDPETGVNMEVHYNSASGERRYVEVRE